MAKSRTSLAGLQCLVLDDEFLIALDIQSILEGEGAAAVTCVSSADDALTALRSGSRFDLAVLDFKLRGKSSSSETVAAELARQNTPFVFLTGASGDDLRLEKYPRAPVVEKPYQPSVLLAAISRALAEER